MSRIRGRGNASTEGVLVDVFRNLKITGWRRHVALPGRPDFVFPRLRIVIFVDGCFWHACPKHFTAPRSRAAFWRAKIQSNRRRDRRVVKLLRARGWHVIRIWEHSLEPRLIRRTTGRLLRRLRKP